MPTHAYARLGEASGEEFPSQTRPIKHRALLAAGRAQFKILSRDGRLQLACGVWSVCLSMACIVAVAIVVARAPALFLGLSEAYMGDLDVSFFAESGNTLNFTHLSNVMATKDPKLQLHSPRYGMSFTAFSAARCANRSLSPWDNGWKYDQAADCIESEEIVIVDWQCGLNETYTTTITSTCFDYYCRQAGTTGRMILIDTERERIMGLGRAWNLPPVPPHSVYISAKLGRALGVGVGDVVIVSIDGGYFWNLLFGWVPQLRIAMNVSAVIENSMGKTAFTDPDPLIFAEYSTFLSSLRSQLPPYLDPDHLAWLATVDLYEYAQRVCFNMPQDLRQEYYLTTDFDSMRTNVYGWVSRIEYYLDFATIRSDASIMFAMRDQELVSIAFQTLLSVMTLMLLLLCILVMHGLLTVGVETKRRTSAILRILGMDKLGVVVGVAVQALTYVVPGWVLGLALAQVMVLIGLDALAQFTNLDLRFWIGGYAIALSTLPGVVSPLLSSLVPLASALGSSIQKGLDSHRATRTLRIFTISRATDLFDEGAIFALAVGGAVICVGFTIWYLVPLAFLSLDYPLLMLIFVAVLVAMFVGLALLSTTVQPLLERLLLLLLFSWWEQPHLVSLARKNLNVHRRRNIQTTAAFALGVGMIVFISVVVQSQFGTFLRNQKQLAGSPLRLDLAPGYAPEVVAAIEEVMVQFSDVIETYAWQSAALHTTLAEDASEITSLGHLRTEPASIYAVSDNFFHTQFDGLLVVDSPKGTAIDDILSSLYTQAGSSGILVSTAYQSSLSLGVSAGDPLLVVASGVRHRMQAQGFLSYSPTFSFSSNPTLARQQDALVSFSTFLRLTNGAYASVDELPLARLHIKLRDGAYQGPAVCFIKRLHRAIAAQPVSISEYSATASGIVEIEAAFRFFANFALAASMLICFSSLISSTIVTVHEQSKEFGVMLAIGMQRWHLYRLALTSTFLLVLGAGLLGVLIGLGAAWVVVAQRQISSDQPTTFEVPLSSVAVVMAVSLCMAAVATLGPVRAALRKPVVQLLRD